MPQEEQFEDEQPLQAEVPADLVVVSPEGPEDRDTNPQADMSLDKSWLPQPGHPGTVLPITRVSNFFLQALHSYS